MDTTHCPYCFSFTPRIPCSNCGWQTSQDNPPPALPLGRVLDGRYRIGRVLGHGGFGITYLAWDENLQLRLAIKEYFPRDSAGRGPDGVSLAVYSGPAGDQFAYGLDRFLEEARTLAHFDQHPGIVTVKNFFRAHSTGYSVMDYVDGITLRQYLEQQPGGRISFADALKLLMPVMDALRAVHKEGLLHRDLAPDNIYLTQDGRIKLLDFGAARFAASEHSKSLSIILKPGYAPEEQYRTRGRQGPWTDVYGLAATFYRAITGQVPPESLDRLDNDDMVPPSRLGIAITPGQEATLLQALAVKAGERLQGMAELQQAWQSGGCATPQSMGEHSGPDQIDLDIPPRVKHQKWAKTALLLALITLFLSVATVALIHFPWPGTTQPTPALAGGSTSPIPSLAQTASTTNPLEPAAAAPDAILTATTATDSHSTPTTGTPSQTADEQAGTPPTDRALLPPGTDNGPNKLGQPHSADRMLDGHVSSCENSDSNVEYTICTNKTLKGLEDQLESAYHEVKVLSNSGEQLMLDQEQKRWIEERELSCGVMTSPQIMECIQEKTTERVRLMRGQPESGTGTGNRIIPVFLIQEGDKNNFELHIQNLRYIDPKSPGEVAANSISQSLLDDVPRRKDENLDNRIYEQMDSLRLTYASPQLISLHYSSNSDTGGAHGSLDTKSFIIDTAKGKLIKFSDIFPVSAIKILMRQCKKELLTEKRKRFEDENYDPSDGLKNDVIAKHIGDFNNWVFDENGASVIFGEYVIGSYAEGSYECHFELSDLYATALPDSPLPSQKSNETLVNENNNNKIPIYYAGDKPPTDNVSQESPLCYKFMVSNLGEQLKKIQKKYPGLYGFKIITNHDDSKTLFAKRMDDNGSEIGYYYHTNASACNDYQHSRFGFNRVTDGNVNIKKLKFPKSFTLADGEEAFKKNDYDRARSILRPLAEAGVALAQDRLGFMYQINASVPNNLDIANLWSKRAVEQYRYQAEAGDARAQYQLSLMYKEGRGVANNEAEAMRLLQKSAEKGNVDAQVALANAYKYGSGIAKDKAKADLWNRKAAEQYLKAAQEGDPKAQYQVGEMYQYGFVLSKNQEEAINWYRKAAEQGQKDAIWELKRLDMSR